jgi:hypothetical protein
MWCEVDEVDQSTLLLPWRCVSNSDVYGATFLVRNGRRSFFVEVGDQARLDPECMVPQNEVARRLLDNSRCPMRQAESVRIRWRPGLVLVVDNHAMLHAREGSRGFHEKRRLLWRALIDEVLV